MKRLPHVFREWIGPLCVGVAAVAACGLQTVVYGPPIPCVHDEFSYLLAADTFACGRCTNPPHALWQHFESMHILQQPTYASKYPPGQGLFLAAGQLLGHPVVGVWLGMGLACGAATWMLRAYLPRWWAICGGLVMAARLGLGDPSGFGYGDWGWSYWGGGVAAAGGALFIGGWVRVLRRPRRLPSTILCLGLVLLAITRPFEGLLLCVPVGMATCVWLVRRHHPARTILWHIVLPGVLVLVPAGTALAYYNYRVTGSPLRLPYVEHAAQYDIAPVLLVQAPYPVPKYRHVELQAFHKDLEFDRDYTSARERWMERVRGKLQLWWRTFLGYGLSLSLLALPWVLLGSPRTRFALAACAFVFTVVATLETWGLPHYTAPVTALLYLVVMQGFRRISLASLWGWPVGRHFARVWLGGCMLVPTFSVMPGIHEPVHEWVASHLPVKVQGPLLAWMRHPRPQPWAMERAKTEHDLPVEYPGRHLILVQYEEGHSVHEEWVYNKADIDSAPVVWARPMGQKGADELAAYFTDRFIWLYSIGPDGLRERDMLRRPVRRMALPRR